MSNKNIPTQYLMTMIKLSIEDNDPCCNIFSNNYH